MHPLLLLAATLTCPALDTSTVAGALGEVQLAVTEKTCVFTNADYRLTLELTKLDAPDQFAHYAETACQSGRDIAPIKAIGNEAIVCTLGSAAQTTEKLVSRVRKQAFTLALTTSAKKSLRDTNRLFAEQVAGNLF